MSAEPMFTYNTTEYAPRVTAYPRDAVLTVDEVADWLQVSERQVQRYPIKRVQLGQRTTRYLAADVYAFLESRAA